MFQGKAHILHYDTLYHTNVFHNYMASHTLSHTESPIDNKVSFFSLFYSDKTAYFPSYKEDNLLDDILVHTYEFHTLKVVDIVYYTKNIL